MSTQRLQNMLDAYTLKQKQCEEELKITDINSDKFHDINRKCHILVEIVQNLKNLIQSNTDSNGQKLKKSIEQYKTSLQMVELANEIEEEKNKYVQPAISDPISNQEDDDQEEELLNALEELEASPEGKQILVQQQSVKQQPATNLPQDQEFQDLSSFLPDIELLNGYRGIKEGTNHCFIHAGLQMILHNKRFCYKILQLKDNIGANDTGFLNNFATLITKYYSESDSTSLTYETDYKFLEVACNLVTRTVEESHHEDVSEFILQTFQNDSFIVNQINLYDLIYKYNTQTKSIKPWQSEPTIVDSDPDNLLKLKIMSGKTTLEDLYLENMTEISNGSKMTANDNLNTIQHQAELDEQDITNMLNRIKQTKISSTKKDLLIMLTRFNAITRTKDNTLIDMPLIWRNFKLKGFILHQGGTGGGHYVYYGIHNNEWIKFDDGSVDENILDIDQLRQQGYLYYYEQDSTTNDKIDDILFPPNEEVFKLEGNFALFEGAVWFIQKNNGDGTFTILNESNSPQTVNGDKLSMPAFDQIQKHITEDILRTQIIGKFEENENKEILESPSKLNNFVGKLKRVFSKGGNAKTQKRYRKPKKRSITNKSTNKKNKSIKKHLKH